MKIAVASDHGGFALKTRLLDFLRARGISVSDLGSNNAAESVDYPDYAIQVAQKVSSGDVDAGLLVCGTGIGMCIVANKFKNVRAAVVSEPYSAKMSKEHNDANVLCLGGRVIDSENEFSKAEKIVSSWLDAQFEGGRHNRRLEKIREIEKKNFKD